MQTRSKLPLRITLLSWLVLITTVWNAVRLVTSITWREALQTYTPHPGPVYVGITGGLCTLVGLLLLLALWRRSPWALPALLLAACAYSVWVWADRLFVQARIPANWLFTLAATLVLLGFTAAVALDPLSQAHFGKEAHEREFQEQSSA
jgi:hypothetical protein